MSRTSLPPTDSPNEAGKNLCVTSLTAEAKTFNSNRTLFSAVRPVVSPVPPEGPAQARAGSYEGGPTNKVRCPWVRLIPLADLSAPSEAAR